jgi:hypothetical protein
MTIEIVGIDVLGGGEDMTKYICNGRSTSGITCHTLCKCEVDSGVRAPTECLLDERECTWRLDCTTEEKKPLAVVDRLEALEKKVQELHKDVMMLMRHTHTIKGPRYD